MNIYFELHSFNYMLVSIIFNVCVYMQSLQNHSHPHNRFVKESSARSGSYFPQQDCTENLSSQCSRGSAGDMSRRDQEKTDRGRLL